MPHTPLSSRPPFPRAHKLTEAFLTHLSYEELHDVKGAAPFGRYASGEIAVALATPLPDADSERPLAEDARHAELKLSNRQLQILICIIEGCQNKVIANRLGIEIATVKMHVGVLFRKLGVSNRTSAAVRGMDLMRDVTRAHSLD